MKNYKKNKRILEKSFNYSSEMEHDACGVGLIASTNGKKSRKIVEYGIEALKAIWHRGAVDADGKSGDGAGIQIEIAPDFFKEIAMINGPHPDLHQGSCKKQHTVAPCTTARLAKRECSSPLTSLRCLEAIRNRC